MAIQYLPIPEIPAADWFEPNWTELSLLSLPAFKMPTRVVSDLLGVDAIAAARVIDDFNLGPEDIIEDLVVKSKSLSVIFNRASWYFTEPWKDIKWHVDLEPVMHIEGVSKRRSVQVTKVKGIESGEFEDWRRPYCVDPPANFMVDDIIYKGDIGPGEAICIGGQGLDSELNEAVGIAHCFGGSGNWLILDDDTMGEEY